MPPRLRRWNPPPRPPRATRPRATRRRCSPPHKTPLKSIQARCCIAGGGPAGMILGYLLARVDVDIVGLAKHGDFLRDFRGDTIHPSTLEIMHEFGVL